MKAAIKQGQGDAGISYTERERPTGTVSADGTFSLLIINY